MRRLLNVALAIEGYLKADSWRFAAILLIVMLLTAIVTALVPETVLPYLYAVPSVIIIVAVTLEMYGRRLRKQGKI